MLMWCENRVEVHGYEYEDELKAFKELVTSDDCGFDFNKILPMPDALESTVKGSEHVPSEELKEKYGFDNWYDWRIHNWGTKWNVDDPLDDMNDEGDYIEYRFETAWAPPEGIYQELKRKFPNLNITWFYDEPGMQFAGYL